MTKDEALKQALDWIEGNGKYEAAKKIAAGIKEALTQPEQEPVAWKNVALELGEELSSVGPNGYYDMTPARWLDWAMAQQPRGKNSLPAAQPAQDEKSCDRCVHQDEWPINGLCRGCRFYSNFKPSTPPAAQRKPLTDEQIITAYETSGHKQSIRPQDVFAVASLVRAIEAAHGIKETT